MKIVNRRDFIKTVGCSTAGLALSGCGSVLSTSAPVVKYPKPNVLFISLDDLNDWIEPLGGHPQAKTPNLVRLAKESVNFTHNYCASPSCLPSRTALLTGRHCYHTGVYSNYQYWREVLPEAVTLPKYFSECGYWSAGAGKIFHNDQPDPASWDDYFPSKTKHMPGYYYPQRGGTVNMPKFDLMYGDFDWSPIEINDEQTGDFKSVKWIIDHLNRDHTNPFFLACGIYRPHLPWYVPRKYFDMFPLESIQLPKVLANDLDDVPERGRDIAYRAGHYHKHVIEADQWRPAVQGYLASIAYADAMLGKLLDALEQSTYADNTIIVLWSDHGWQFGEKEHWRKFALWENVAKTVMMMKVPPGVAGLPSGSKAGVRCDRITSLMDIFPTLVDLCQLPPKSDLDGRSLVPLLKDPKTPWDYPAITTYDFNEFSIRTEDFRYIHYIDDSEELYNHRTDPEEWTNVASDPRYKAIKAQMAQYTPANPAPVTETSYRLAPHHIPPLKSKEEYLKLKKIK
ncbi:sulfatase-like hydrolase/transferase [Planctomycetota bacterium]